MKFYNFIGESKVNSLKKGIKICLIHANKSHFICLALESIFGRQEKIMSTQKPVSDVYCNFIDSCQNLEPTKTPFNKLMAKLRYILTMPYYSVLKEMNDLAMKRHGDINMRITK